MTQVMTSSGASFDSAALKSAADATGSGVVVLQTSPTIITPTLTTPTLNGALITDTKFCTTQFDAVTGTTGTTLTNIVGLTAFAVVAGGVYKWDIQVSGVCTTNGGIKLGLKLTTTTLTTLQSLATLHAAASTATVQVTSTTDQASLVASKAAAWLGVRISGMLVVNAAGTLALQAAQETAHADTTSVYVGSSMTLTRVS